MKRAVIIAVGTASVTILAVVVVVTVVVTTNSDNPKPQLDLVVSKATQGYMVGKVTPEAGIFRGIPFSQPPIGEHRWKNPREPLNFDQPYWDATYSRPACIQTCSLPAEEYSCPTEVGGLDASQNNAQTKENLLDLTKLLFYHLGKAFICFKYCEAVNGRCMFDEDCLYLNVWVPTRLLTTVKEDEILTSEHYVIPEEKQTGDNNALAVMVYLHGGNFINGAGSVPLYDNRFLADQGNIVGVTTNYRMGPIGFLVQGEGEDAAEGNYGMWDIVRTLEWVRDNIKYFGGNPNKVTVFGQSAGAEAIGVLMTSPYTKNSNMFHQSIMESNPFGLPFRDYENAKEFGERFAEAAGCGPHDMDCLRKLDTDTITQAYRDTTTEIVGVDKLFLLFQPWSPVIEGDFLPEQPIDAFMKGEMVDIPSIFGFTVDEAMGYVAGAFREEVSNTQYRAVIRAIAKEDSQEVLEKYPPECPTISISDCDNRFLMSDLASEFLFICPNRAALREIKADTWLYIFNETWSFYELWNEPLCFDHVCHAAELPYVFNMENLTVYSFTEDEGKMADRLVWYWTNFAKYGNPNGNPAEKIPPDNTNYEILNEGQVDAIYWPKMSENNYSAIQFTAEGDLAMIEPYKEKCDFWDGLDSYADHYMLYNNAPHDDEQ